MRDGVYLYMPNEIGTEGVDPMIPIPCYRPASEVVKACEKFQELKKLPICVKHPDSFLNFNDEKTWENGYADKPALTQNSAYTVIDCEFVIKNKVLDNYTSGVRQVSCGWEGDFEKVEIQDVNSHGCQFIQRFKDINHIAMVENGRCGDICRITDSKKVNDADLTALKEGKKVEMEHEDTLKKLYQLVKGGISLEDFIKKGAAYIAGDHIEELGGEYYTQLKKMEKNLEMKDGGKHMSKSEKLKAILDKKGLKISDETAKEVEKELDDDDEDDDKFKKKYSDVKKKYDALKKKYDDDDEPYEGKETEEEEEEEERERKDKKKKDKKAKDSKKKHDDDDDDDDDDKKKMVDSFNKGADENKKQFLDGMADVLPILGEFKTDEVKGKTPCEIKSMFIKKESGQEISDSAPELNAVFQMVLKNRTHPSWNSKIKDSTEPKTLADEVNAISFKKEE